MCIYIVDVLNIGEVKVYTGIWFQVQLFTIFNQQCVLDIWK